MKKIAALVLVLFLCFGTVSPSRAEDRVVLHLTRCTFNLQAPDPAQVKKVEDAINAYIADRLNVEIRLTDIGAGAYGEYGEKVLAALERNEINLLWTASWETGVSTNDLMFRDALYDLTELLPGSDLYASIARDQWESTKYGGRNFFIPVYKDNVEGYDFMFRKDLADQFGWDITAVNTLSDLEPMLADAKSIGLKYPFLTQRTAMFYRWYLDRFDFFTGDASANFIAVDRSSDQVVDTVLTPEYAAFSKLMGSWMEKGYISSDDVNRVTNDVTPRSKDWAVTWWTDVPVNAEASARYGQNVIVRHATGWYEHSNSALGSCYCVSASSSEEQARAAVDFMGLLYTDSTLADLYTFGIEGEDFEYTQEPGQAIRHVIQHSDQYSHSMWDSASATVVTPMVNEPDNKADLYLDFNGSAIVSRASGFRFDPRPVADAYEACRQIFEEYGFRLENGAVPEAEVDACIADYQRALDAAGYQEILAEAARQYEDWKK